MRALLAALLLTAACGAAYGSNGITTQQAFIAAPLPIDLSGATPADAGTSLSFIRADAERALTGQLPLTLGGTGYSTTIPTCSNTATQTPLFTSTGIACLSVQLNGNPALKVVGGGQSVSNSSATTLKPATVSRDTASGYSASTGAYTIPANKGGDWYVGYGFGWQSTPGASGVTQVNASGSTAGTFCLLQMANSTLTAQLDGFLSFSRGCVQNLAAGETVVLQVTQNSGGTLTTGTAPAGTEFIMKRLGD